MASGIDLAAYKAATGKQIVVDYCCTADPLAWVWPQSLVVVWLLGAVICLILLSLAVINGELRDVDGAEPLLVVFFSAVWPLLLAILLIEETPRAMRAAAEARSRDDD